MPTLGSADVLYIGLGQSALGWYRSAMPAFYLGCDWVGLRGGDPDDYELHAALTRDGCVRPQFDHYKIVIMQQVAGELWEQKILDLREQGIRVLYEIDDYLPAIAEARGHLAADKYTQDLCDSHHQCMAVCDGLVTTTEWVADQYRPINPNVWLCPNGIEIERYSKFIIPPRDTVNIGWAGGTGHDEAMQPLLPMLADLMDADEEIIFVTIGEPYGWQMPERLRTRCLSIPFSSVENFPSVMTNIDIAMAPAGRSDFFKAKSDLRWLEASAMGIPSVLDPFVYRDVVDGETGLLASTPDEFHIALGLLLDDHNLRAKISANAREYVSRERSISRVVEYWEKAFVEVYAGALTAQD